jgi:nicotinate phosphoribosyltransferase
MIDSVIWDDLYKVTMGQAAFRLYDTCEAHYEFIDRGNTKFPKDFAEELRRFIRNISHRTMTDEEREFLTTIGSPRPFLRPAYIDWLANYHYNPDEVEIQQDGGKLKIDIKGPWYRTIRWEVKLMAMIVALYNELMDRHPKDGWLESTEEKGMTLWNNTIFFSDFGTRRAFSPHVHDQVLKTLMRSAGNCLVGTSNLYLAMKYGIKPMGTKAH